MSLCYGCMEDKKIEDTTCPLCGHINGQNSNEHYYLEEGTKLHSRYVVGKVLGHGGFGITYIGLDMTLDIKVAIKEYLPSEVATRALGESTVTVFSGEKSDQYHYGLTRFLDEAKTLAKYNAHPCIVSSLDFFEDNNTAYLVMEFLDGIPLNEYLKRKGGTLSWEEILKILTPIMDALREVHQSGMIHRDISPDNIYITKSGQIKLIDFGAARFALGEKSRSLSVVLKPGYAPPEQYFSKGKQGPWTDVYAIAGTMYRMLHGEALQEATERLLSDELEITANVPTHIKNVLIKSLETKHENRYQSIQALQEALKRAEESREQREEPKYKVHKEVPINSQSSNNDELIAKDTNRNKAINTSRDEKSDMKNKSRVPMILGILAIVIIGSVFIMSIINKDKHLTWEEVSSQYPISEGKVSVLEDFAVSNYGSSITPFEVDELYIDSGYGTIDTFEEFGFAKNLKKLTIKDVEVVDWNSITLLESLEELTLNNVKIGIEAHLRGVNLRNLNIQGEWEVGGLSFIQHGTFEFLSIENFQSESPFYNPMNIFLVNGIVGLELDGDYDYDDWDILVDKLSDKGYLVKSSVMPDPNNYTEWLDEHLLRIKSQEVSNFDVLEEEESSYVQLVGTHVNGNLVFLNRYGENLVEAIIRDQAGTLVSRESLHLDKTGKRGWISKAFLDDQDNLYLIYSEIYKGDYIIKYNELGHKIWEKKFVAQIEGVSFTSEGLPVIIAQADEDFEWDDYYGSDNRQAYIAMLSDDGTILWDKLLGGSEDEYPRAIYVTEDNHIIAGIGSYSSEINNGEVFGDSDQWILEFDEDGHIVQETVMGSYGYDSVDSIIEGHNGELIICGTSYSANGLREESFGEKDVWIYALDENFEMIWQRSLGSDWNDYGKIYRTNEGYMVFYLTREEVPIDSGGITWEYRRYHLVALSDIGGIVETYTLDDVGNDINIDNITQVDTDTYLIEKSNEVEDLNRDDEGFWEAKNNSEVTINKYELRY